MISFGEMLLRLGVAILLGALVGFERESIGKKAGVRTAMLVAGGAALFSLVAISLPYRIAQTAGDVPAIIAGNSGFLMLIANVVVGIGFLGAGIIVRQGTRVIGLTTAASVWFVAAIGVAAGVGLIALAATTTLGMIFLLITTRRIDFHHRKKEIQP